MEQLHASGGIVTAANLYLVDADEFRVIADLPIERLKEIGDRQSLRAEYRYFWDNWAIKAHTLEVGYARYFGDKWLAEGFGRVYKQSKASFYSDNAQAETTYISRNRQLGSFDSWSLGAPPSSKTRGERLNGTTMESLRRHREGLSVPEIASERGLAEGTIYGHLSTAVLEGEAIDVGRLFSRSDLEAIAAETSEQRRTQIDAQLRDYCALDSYAMVVLWAKLAGRAVPAAPSAMSAE